MASMRELQAEYELLSNTHRQLVEERIQLQREAADGPAFQDHGHKMRAYMAAFQSYVLALSARRQELRRKKTS